MNITLRHREYNYRAFLFRAERRIAIVFAVALLGTQPAAALSVSFDAGSATYPAGTTCIAANFGECDAPPGAPNGLTSATADPLGPLSGQSVNFRGTDRGGQTLIYRYRLDFGENVELASIKISGAAWDSGSDTVSLLDSGRNLIDQFDASEPFGNSNVFLTKEFSLANVVGQTFFLEEENGDPVWRYRSEIKLNTVSNGTAVPEPATVLLICAGLFLLGRARWLG